MMLHVETNAGRCKVRIDGDVNIYNAIEMKRQLLDHLGSAAELEINLAQVGEMDTAGFQVLCLTKREAAKAGKTLRLTSHSPAALEIMDMYNMAAYFGDPVVISGTRKKAHAPRPKPRAKKARKTT